MTQYALSSRYLEDLTKRLDIWLEITMRNLEDGVQYNAIVVGFNWWCANYSSRLSDLV